MKFFEWLLVPQSLAHLGSALAAVQKCCSRNCGAYNNEKLRMAARMTPVAVGYSFLTSPIELFREAMTIAIEEMREESRPA
jgi:hypothetical protein